MDRSTDVVEAAAKRHVILHTALDSGSLYRKSYMR